MELASLLLFSSLGNGSDEGLSEILKIKALTGFGEGKSQEEFKGYILAPASRRVLDNTYTKVAALSDEEKDKLLAALITKLFADSLLEEDKEDEFANTMGQLSKQIILRFLFGKTPTTKKRIGNRGLNNNLGGAIIGEHDISDVPMSPEDRTLSLNIEGNQISKGKAGPAKGKVKKTAYPPVY